MKNYVISKIEIVVISQKIPAKIKKVRDKHNSLCYVHNV